MRYEAIMEQVLGSTHDDWVRVEEGGLTVYKDRFLVMGVGPDSGRIYDVDSHYGAAVLAADVNIWMAWGMEPRFLGDAQGKSTDWSSFPDRTVSYHVLDLFYANSLIKRIEYVIVDGARGILPSPSPEADENHEITGWTVSSVNVNLTRLLSQLSFPHADFNHNIAVAGFRIT